MTECEQILIFQYLTDNNKINAIQLHICCMQYTRKIQKLSEDITVPIKKVLWPYVFHPFDQDCFLIIFQEEPFPRVVRTVSRRTPLYSSRLRSVPPTVPSVSTYRPIFYSSDVGYTPLGPRTYYRTHRYVSETPYYLSSYVSHSEMNYSDGKYCNIKMPIFYSYYSLKMNVRTSILRTLPLLPVLILLLLLLILLLLLFK